MSLVRRTLLALSLATIASLFCSHLYARGTTDKSHTFEPCGKTCPPRLHVGVAPCCTTRSVWCPDDYRPKCAPCIRPPTYCGTCDGYQAKCAPCIRPPKYCGTCDDYDAKCFPYLNIPCRFPSFYKCASPECCGDLAATPGTGKQPGR